MYFCNKLGILPTSATKKRQYLMENEENSIDQFFDTVETHTTNAHMQKKDSFAGQLCKKGYNVALIGVSDHNVKNGNVADAIRKELYSLKGGFKNLKIADLGNIKSGSKKNNTFFGLQYVIEQLTSKGIVCIVMGNNQNFTIATVEGVRRHNNEISLTVLDSRLDLGTSLTMPSKTNENNFLLPLTIHPSVSFCNVLGFQQYYCSNSQLQYMEQHNAIDTFARNVNNIEYTTRIGRLRQNLFKAEPILRDTDILSIDMNVVRQADAPAATHPSPNGFQGEEICQLLQYAGTSDRLSVVGLFGMENKFDQRGQTAALAAQMLWHLIEGLDNRAGDYPATSIDNCKMMVIPGEKENELHFYYSDKLQHWWVEVPTKNGKRIMACQAKDYEEAKMGIKPNVWFRHFLK